MRLFERIWDLAARHPLLAMTLAVAAQTAYTLNSRALWFSDEVRYANAYENMERAGAWVVLALNGVPYPDKPPLYFWLLSLLDRTTPLDPPAVFFAGAALTGLAFLMATHALGRALGLSRERSFMGCLVVLSLLFFAALLHYSRMDLLFAALILLAQAGLARTFVRGHGSGWAVGGLALAGMAVLVKGPLGLLFPLAALAAYLLWRGEARRLFSAPVGLGLLAAAAVCSCWVLAAWAVEGPDFVRTVFVEQIFQRAANTFHHKEGPLYYFAVLPAVSLPWTLFLLGLPVSRLFTREPWSGLLASRRRRESEPEAEARVWLWWCWASAFALLTALSGKVVIYLLPLLAPMALLTADALTRLDVRRRARGFTAMAALLLLLASAIPLANRFTAFDQHIQGLPLAAAALAATATALLLLRRTLRPALAALVLGTMLFMAPANLVVAPSLDPVMSPKAMAERIGSYMDRGYAAVAYDTYPGIYTYYAGHDLVQIPKHFAEIHELYRARDGKVVVAMKKKHLARWPERPETLQPVFEQWIADQPYVLLAPQP